MQCLTLLPQLARYRMRGARVLSQVLPLGLDAAEQSLDLELRGLLGKELFELHTVKDYKADNYIMLEEILEDTSLMQRKRKGEDPQTADGQFGEPQYTRGKTVERRLEEAFRRDRRRGPRTPPASSGLCGEPASERAARGVRMGDPALGLRAPPKGTPRF